MGEVIVHRSASTYVGQSREKGRKTMATTFINDAGQIVILCGSVKIESTNISNRGMDFNLERLGSIGSNYFPNNQLDNMIEALQAYKVAISSETVEHGI